MIFSSFFKSSIDDEKKTSRRRFSSSSSLLLQLHKTNQKPNENPQLSLLWCAACERYLQPPKHWARANPESKELLTLCLRRIKGIGKGSASTSGSHGGVRLVDAGFIWTEPHSRRIKVKLTVQAEVLGGATLQQACVVDFTVEPHQCIDCTRAATNAASWIACAQVRQHVGHKRTFFFLEQAVLRARADASATGVRAAHGGLDFYFASRAQCSKFVDFVQSAVPARHRSDKQLVSHNTHTSTYNYKYTFSVEIAPICRVRTRRGEAREEEEDEDEEFFSPFGGFPLSSDIAVFVLISPSLSLPCLSSPSLSPPELHDLQQDDLLCLPAKLCNALGGLGPLVLVSRVSALLTLTDPSTLREAHLNADQYWRGATPLRALMGSRQLVEYVVLDVEPVNVLPAAELREAAAAGGMSAATLTMGGQSYAASEAGANTKRYALADVTVARRSDFGQNDRVTTVRSHLGALLKPGDTALGYDLAAAAPSDEALDAAVESGRLSIPDALLVRKSHDAARARRRARGERRPWVLKRLDVNGGEGGEEAAAAAAAAEAASSSSSRRRAAANAGGAGSNAAADDAADYERFMEELEEDPDLRARVALYKAPDVADAAAAAPPPPSSAAGAAAGAAAADERMEGSDEEEEDDDVPQVPLEELLDDMEALGIRDEQQEQQGGGGEGKGDGE